MAMKPQPIQGVNLGYVVELYERYLENPDSVDRATRAVFDTWRPVDAEAREPRGVPEFQTIVGVANLAEGIWRHRSIRSAPPRREIPRSCPKRTG